jgi:hypothetical protein
MTTDIEQVPGWATGGTKTAPSAGLSVSGWTAGAQPTAPTENYLRDEERDKINELVDDVNGIKNINNSGFSSTSQVHLSTKLQGGAGFSFSRTHQMYDVDNASTETANDKVDIGVWHDADGARKLLVLD